MLFLTEILGAAIVDVHQRRIGVVRDLAVQVKEPYPVVTSLIVSGGGRSAVPWDEVRTFAAATREVALRRPKEDYRGAPRPPEGVWLSRDVLDKQVVDTDGRRVVRVNDLQLAETSGGLLLVGADIGVRGILRRLALEGLVKALVRLFGRDLPMVLVSWDVVSPLAGGPAGGEAGADSVQLRIKSSRIAKLHPADIADIVEDLGAKERRAVFSSLSEEVAADTLEEMELEDQVSVIEHMDPGRASEILEEMEPDDVADILEELPDEQAKDLLRLMDRADAAEVEELLAYDEDSAGGLMSLDYVAVPMTFSAQECINELRRRAPEARSIYYVFAVDEHEHLRGVLSLRDLIVADPARPVEEIMTRDVVAVELGEEKDRVLAAMSKYSLLAVPVVDEEYRLQGVVSVDDAVEAVLPEAVKRRLPRSV